MARRKDITRKTVTITKSQMARCVWMMQEGGYLNFSSLVRTALQYYYEKRYPDYVFKAAKKNVEAKVFSRKVSSDPTLNPDVEDITELSNEQICEQMGGEVEGTKCAVWFTKGEHYNNAQGRQLGRSGIKFELSDAPNRYAQWLEGKGEFVSFSRDKGFIPQKEFEANNPGSPD